MTLNFSVMFEDTETARVSLGDNKYFDVQLLTEDKYTHPFFIMPTDYDYIVDWLDSRSVDRERSDLEDILNRPGIEDYDTIEILRKTHGVSYDDPMWIRFEGETVTWNDVRVK